jgi:hypothetical protein
MPTETILSKISAFAVITLMYCFEGIAVAKDKTGLFDEARYLDAIIWIYNHPEDTSLPESVKYDLRRFVNLTDAEKEQLQDDLLNLSNPPEVIKKFAHNRLMALPDDLLKKITDSLNRENMVEPAKYSKRIHTLFQSKAIVPKFLECVAYGQQDKVGQDKAEHLLSVVFKGKAEKIQETLRYQGTFTDYSGRTFTNCSAFEYAYWAKDEHRCRMLIGHMDEDTKAKMLERCEAIDQEGLTYVQEGRTYKSKCFDFGPLITALQEYVNGFNNWVDSNNCDAMNEAWLKVGKAQRNVPVHVANEYCREEHSFERSPGFYINEAALSRSLTFYNLTTGGTESWFPLGVSSSSGLGVDFALFRGRLAADGARRWAPECGPGTLVARVDLAGIIRLNDVRTENLKQLRQALQPIAAGSVLIKKE